MFQYALHLVNEQLNSTVQVCAEEFESPASKRPVLILCVFACSFSDYRPKLESYQLFQIRILVRIRRRAATEKTQRLLSHDRVPRS